MNLVIGSFIILLLTSNHIVATIHNISIMDGII